ncbi:hypothetical protein QQF64_029199 [Cirrhinus molitorella]|uniref:Uncharacterized protein n=1 Tax=Cirrhinus molitorella TaxID=172907 RepID=A0ABR3N917_9TELE
MGEGEQPPNPSGTNVWSSSSFPLSLMIPLGNDDLQGDTRGSLVSWRRTYTRLVGFGMVCGIPIGVKTGTGTPLSSLTKGKRKAGPDIYTARFAGTVLTAYYILPSAFKNSMCGFGLLA